MQELLPFEKIERQIIIRKKAKTNPEHGCKPEERPISELINYGIINLNKPSGPSSHQVSDYVQKILEIKKSGHSGTLDPKVTGILPVALGKATRIVQALLNSGKEYVCLMHLHKEFQHSKIHQVAKEFTGKIKQLPPVKSAVKRQERTREIYYLNIMEIEGQDVLFRVGCEAGTYIRKLCLHPNTEIISKESLISAKDFFINPKWIFTVNNKKIQQEYPSETQKFNFKGKLLKITMALGIHFLVTPDHRMLVSTDEGYVMKQASRLTNLDYIVKSLSYPLPEISYIISDLLDNSYLVDQEDIKEKVKEAFIKKYRSIREMNRKLRLDRKAFLKDSKISIPVSHIKKSGIYESVKNKIYNFKTEKGIKIKCPQLNSEMMYLMGLIASDGNNTKEKGTVRYTRIKFHNKNKELIDSFIRKYRKTFPDFNITKTIRDDGLIQLDTSNSFFATICANLGVKSPHKESDLLPILYLNKKLIAAFLRGYFDGDGTAYYKKKSNGKGIDSRIAIYSMDELSLKRIHQMLLKLDISNKIFKQKHTWEKGKIIWLASINDIASKKRFISLVGSNHSRKKEKFKLIKKMKSAQLKDNLHISFHYKKYIKEKRSKLTKFGGNLSRILNSQVPLTRGFYRRANKIISLPSLDDFCIEKIKHIELIDYNGVVYDMTVPETHNFLIETGFVSSNCHEIGVKLGSGAHMAQLIRTKAGPFTDKDWITLHDLKDAYEFYKQGDEDSLKKTILPIERAVDHLGKVWVLDSCVDSLCHGANLSVPGIAQFNDVKKGETVALMTLKNELISLGTMLIDAEEIMDNEKGLAVKSSKVFMDREIYPKYVKDATTTT